MKKQLKHRAGAYVFYLKPVGQGEFLMGLAQSDQPAPPMVEVTYAGGVKVMEPNKKDREYQQLSRTWQAQYNAKMLRMCIVSGVDRVMKIVDGKEIPAVPSAEEITKIRFVYGANLTLSEVTYYWYSQILENTANGFMNLVIGQGHVTTEGLKQDEDRFRRDGKRSRVHGEDNELPSETEMEDLDPVGT